MFLSFLENHSSKLHTLHYISLGPQHLSSVKSIGWVVEKNERHLSTLKGAVPPSPLSSAMPSLTFSTVDTALIVVVSQRVSLSPPQLRRITVCPFDRGPIDETVSFSLLTHSLSCHSSLTSSVAFRVSWLDRQLGHHSITWGPLALCTGACGCVLYVSLSLWPLTAVQRHQRMIFSCFQSCNRAELNYSHL